MLELVASDECDVAVGSRFLPDSGSDGERYKPAPERVVGTSLLRLLMRLRLGQPISDGTSGLYAVDQKALELLADDYLCEAPEVEALMRITDAKLRLVEVPVHMRQREHGESSFRGKRAVELVVTIGLTLFAAKLLRQRHEHRQRRDIKRVLRAARPRLKPIVSATRAGELHAPAELTRRPPRPQHGRGCGAVAGVVEQVRAEGGERGPAVPRSARRPRHAADARGGQQAVRARARRQRGRVPRPGGTGRDDVIEIDHQRRGDRGAQHPLARARGQRRDDQRGERRVLQRVAVHAHEPRQLR